MKCIECYSPVIYHHHHHLKFQHDNSNGRRIANLSWMPCGKSFGCMINQQRQYGNVVSKVLPLNVEAFPSSTSLTLLAVAKRPDTIVLIQTSAVLIFFYVIANFVVPQILTKSWEADQVDETEKPSGNDSVSETEVKARSKTSKRGFNSTKPK